MKFAVFRIGKEDFAIDIGKVVEFLRTQRVYALPELPDFLSGVITVRGEVLPLLDLRKRFSIQSSQTEELIIIVRYDDEKIGLLVDEIKEILSLSPEEITAPPRIFKGLKEKYLTGLGKKDERVIILLNIDHLLSSEEKIMLKDSGEGMEENAGTGKITER
jgi:purine-binding chemotaxis protein CheW